MLKRNCCGKGERALPMQIGNLVHCAEVRSVRCAVARADTYAELRAVVRAEPFAEKMAPMQLSMQKAMQLSVQRLG